MPQVVPAAAGAPEWEKDAAQAATELLKSADFNRNGVVTKTELAECWQVLRSRSGCKHGDECRTSTCRFSHADDNQLLWSSRHVAQLVCPKSFGPSAGNSQLLGQEWAIYKDAFTSLGAERFMRACSRQAAALQHFLSREGARIICRGLPEPDELQALAMRRVAEVWGDGVVHRASCQEYLDRSAARTRSTITGGDYSAPGRSRVAGHWGGPQGEVTIARVVKVGINNPNYDRKKESERDTAWHGCQARDLNSWKPAKPGTHPQFRVEKVIHAAHRPGIYVSPSFEQAVLYAFRRWDKQPRFATFKTKSGERWNYLTVMQLALYDRGKKGVVDECPRTWPNASTDGWDAGKLEWVVRDVDKAQIYGILFCFFPDDPPQGG